MARNGDPDGAIRLTDTDAAMARVSAVGKGYVEDPYIKHFVPRGQLQTARPPLINIGTYLRGTAIDRLVDQWLERSAGPCQIVSLGAGSDTRFWRIAVRGAKKVKCCLDGEMGRLGNIQVYWRNMWRLILER